jgi:murein DD-endopeptidase MepM/ murein hydrolase activator NlpD
MKLIAFLRRQIKTFRRRRNYFLFLALLVMTTCIAIGTMGQQPLQAQSTPTALRSNPWLYASFPVENFQAYTSPFGYRTSPIDGTTKFHYGLDMAAPLGSYVRNWWTGRVVELSDGTGCGTAIKIESGQWRHVYCHLMGHVEETPQGRYLIDREGGILLWQGQDVPVGARIARVGMTGRTTGPHLHWELLHGGKHLDPALVLQEMYNQRSASRSR